MTEKTFCDKCRKDTESIRINDDRIECAECRNIKEVAVFNWGAT